jgi:hypothetical protein
MRSDLVVEDSKQMPQQKKRYVDPSWIITLAVVLCSIVYITYTVRSFDLAQKHWEVVKTGEGKSKQVFPNICLFLDAKARIKVWVEYDGTSSDVFVPIHEPLGKEFAYMKSNGPGFLRFYHNLSRVLPAATPAQLKLAAGDTILIKFEIY